MTTRRHTLFASDLHLDSEAPWAIDAFLKFLDGEARGAEALYLLGDLFEVWVGDDDDDPDHARACAGLARLTASGVVVYALHGNRDFLLGAPFEQRTGVKLLPDPVLVELYGVPTLLSHGDAFCTEDTSYQELRSIVRTPAWQRRFLSLSLDSRRPALNPLGVEEQSATLSTAIHRIHPRFPRTDEFLLSGSRSRLS